MSPSSSSDRPRKSAGAKSTKSAKSAKTSKAAKPATPSSVSRTRSDDRASRAAARQLRTRDARTSLEGLAGLSEQLVNRILEPLGLLVLSRERIAETVNEAAARGRLTRRDAELLAMELVQRGRQQTDDLLSDLDRTLGRGRQQLDAATRRARMATSDGLMRRAVRARRRIGVGPSFPIPGYDDMTVPEVQRRLSHLSDPELRTVRDYERRGANRKSLLRAIENALGVH